LSLFTSKKGLKTNQSKKKRTESMRVVNYNYTERKAIDCVSETSITNEENTASKSPSLSAHSAPQNPLRIGSYVPKSLSETHPARFKLAQQASSEGTNNNKNNSKRHFCTVYYCYLRP